MFLDVSAQALPLSSSTAQGGQKMKVGVFGSEMVKLLAIVNVLLAARTEKQPELASLMPIAFRQQPVQHGTEGRDPGSTRDKHSVAQRRAENEIAKWPLKHDLRAFVETAKIVRHESILHAIQTEGEVPIRGRRRRDRIRARHLLAIGSGGLDREPLSGNETETRDAVCLKFNMLGKFGKRNGAKHARVESFEMRHSFM